MEMYFTSSILSSLQDDMVIEDMYVPGKKAQYLYKGYSIITETVEGTIYN